MVTITIPDALALASQHHQAGRLAEAADVCRRVLQARPDHPEALLRLGVIEGQTGHCDRAARLLSGAAEHSPGLVDAHRNLGQVLLMLARADEAAVRFRRALELAPGDVGARQGLEQALQVVRAQGEAAAGRPHPVLPVFNAAAAAHAQGRLDEAIALYHRALALKPDFLAALCNLGAALKVRGRVEEALVCYRRALAINPGFADAHNNMGTALRALGRLDEAVGCYRQAVRAQPDYARARYNLGTALVCQGRLDEAGDALRAAVALQPDYVEALGQLGEVQRGQGRIEEARESFRRVWQIGRAPVARLKTAIALPIIPRSLEEIDTTRRTFLEAVRAMAADGLRLTDPLHQISQTCFYLAYHALDDRPLQKALAELYAAACPELLYTAPHCRTPRPVPAAESGGAGRRRRVGFLSGFFCTHTIGRLNRGLIENLSRERFHVTVFAPSHPHDALQQALRAASDAFVVLPDDLEAARRCIAEQELDLLYYADIGMSASTYFLAFSRLAPVQCVTWGHPDTTAIPNLDYFVSCDAMEPEGAERHYTETLARLPGPTTYYYRPEPPPPRTKADYGLPADAHLYLCPQSLFKIHPDYDAVLVAILRRDPAGLLAFIRGKDTHINDTLMARLRAAGPDVAGRIRLLPPLNTPDFIVLMGLCAVMLDPLHYSGGNTSLEAFSVGTPIVTWPGEFMRGRHTYGFYKLMGLDECVARDWDDYVAIALRLGTDPAYRTEVSRRILAANGVLYENRDTVRAIEDFLDAAIRGADAARDRMFSTLGTLGQPEEAQKTVLHATPEQAVSTWCLRPGQAIARHRHPRGQDTWIVLSGEADYDLGAGAPRRLRPGDVAIAHPDEPHGARNTGSQDFVFVSVLAPADAQADRQTSEPSTLPGRKKS